MNPPTGFETVSLRFSIVHLHTGCIATPKYTLMNRSFDARTACSSVCIAPKSVFLVANSSSADKVYFRSVVNKCILQSIPWFLVFSNPQSVLIPVVHPAIVLLQLPMLHLFAGHILISIFSVICLGSNIPCVFDLSIAQTIDANKVFFIFSPEKHLVHIP